MGVRHNYQSNTPNDPADEVSSDRWNEDHVITGPVPFPHVAAPALPPADHVSLFGRRLAGRILPAFVGPAGLDSALQPFFGRNRVAHVGPIAGNTTLNQLGIAIAGFGTATAAALARTNLYTSMRRIDYLVTTAATTAIAGWRVAQGQNFLGQAGDKFGGFFAVWRFGRPTGAAANATLRAFNGMSSIFSAPADANPSTAETNALGVGCDATDTNWQIIHRNGSAAATKIDTGFPKAVADASEMYELILFSPPANATVVHYRFTRLSDEAFVEGTITTNLPTTATLLGPKGYYSVGGTSSVIGYALSSYYCETDF